MQCCSPGRQDQQASADEAAVLAVLATHQRFELVQLCIQDSTALQHCVVACCHIAAHHSGRGGLQAGQHQQADGLEAQGLSKVQGRGRTGGQGYHKIGCE